MNTTPNSNNGDDRNDRRKQDGFGDDDDEDDRKPPAKEIHLVQSDKQRQRRRRRNNANNHDSSSNLTQETASMSSWVSPVVARLPSSSSNNGKTKANEKQRLPSLAPMTPFSTNSSLFPQRKDVSAQKQQQSPPSLRSIQMILSMWITTVLMSIIYFAYLILPAMAFSTLAFMAVSSAAFAASLIAAAQSLYQDSVVHGNGLGSLLLPESINQLLTETSMHEYLSDSGTSTMNNYQYLALYFLPLTQRQRNAALARLAPDHLNRLHQPGLARWVSNSEPWRLLVGNQRYYQNHQQPPAIDIPSGPLDAVIETGTGGDDSSSSSLGLDITGDEHHVVRRLSLEEDEDENENAVVVDSNANELDVILDAVWTSTVNTVIYPVFTSLYQFIWPVTTVSSSMVGMATGVVWMVRGRRDRSRNNNWMVVIGGGATVILSMVGARYGLRAMLPADTSNGEEEQKGREKSKKR